MKKIFILLSLAFFFSCGVDTDAVKGLLDSAEDAYNAESESQLLPLVAEDTEFYQNVKDNAYMSGLDFEDFSFSSYDIPEDNAEEITVIFKVEAVNKNTTLGQTDSEATADLVNIGSALGQDWKISRLEFLDEAIYKTLPQK